MRVITRNGDGSRTTGYEVCSDDFAHDVTLEITGDFEDIEQLREYAEWLAAKLNTKTVISDR